MKIWEITNKKLENLGIQNLDLTSFETFKNSLKQIPRDQLIKLQTIWDNLKEESRKGLKELYHGTPQKHVPIIKGSGFELTKGQRSLGFMGAPYLVHNQGIFLTDSKSLAHFYGSNRSEYGGDYEILIVYTDISDILDTTKSIPKELVKLGIQLLKSWDGKTRKRIPVTQWWWLLDRPEFVDLMHKMGYSGAKFIESREIRRAAGDSGFTYLIFDPKIIKIKGDDTYDTIYSFYSWLQEG
jgi:hypothetical protein